MYIGGKVDPSSILQSHPPWRVLWPTHSLTCFCQNGFYGVRHADVLPVASPARPSQNPWLPSCVQVRHTRPCYGRDTEGEMPTRLCSWRRPCSSILTSPFQIFLFSQHPSTCPCIPRPHDHALHPLRLCALALPSGRPLAIPCILAPSCPCCVLSSPHPCPFIPTSRLPSRPCLHVSGSTFKCPRPCTKDTTHDRPRVRRVRIDRDDCGGFLHSITWPLRPVRLVRSDQAIDLALAASVRAALIHMSGHGQDRPLVFKTAQRSMATSTCATGVHLPQHQG